MWSASVAEAGSVYQFAFDQLTYEVDPGTQVLVNVFLQEQVSAGTSSVLATDGLIGAGVRAPSTCLRCRAIRRRSSA